MPINAHPAYVSVHPKTSRQVHIFKAPSTVPKPWGVVFCSLSIHPAVNKVPNVASRALHNQVYPARGIPKRSMFNVLICIVKDSL